jgi:serine/threonine-protein kinase RsbT
MDNSPRPGGLSGSLLAVVAREELPKYTSLNRNFVGATMEVVLDRRSGERRRADYRVTMERRGRDRRQRDVTIDLQTSGWALVRRDAEAASDSTRWSLGPGMEPARVRSEALLPVANETDALSARDRGRELAVSVGLSPTDSASVAAAVSELVRNLITYATCGEVILRTLENERARGVEVIVIDEGPGIADIEQALQERFSTSGGLGLGLPGVRRLMDEVQIASRLGRGTTVAIRKWRSNR